MSRLQFIHLDGASSGITRQNAVDYIKRLTNEMIHPDKRLEKSLIGEPIAVTYLDDNGKTQVMFGIGTKGELSDNEFAPYHIIDSAKLAEDIEEVSGATEGLREELEAEIERAQAAEQALDEKIDAEIERAQAAEQALQNELDTTQAGAGLNEDGTYHRHNTQGESNYIHEATSLDEADMVLDRELARIDGEALRNIIVNDVTGTVNDNIAEVTIDGEDIKIGDYEEYDGRANTPHPIHDDYTVLESVKQLDTNLMEFMSREQEEREGIHLIKLTEEDGLPANVREAYQLVNKDGLPMPNTARVDIYKDSALKKVYLGHTDDRLEDYTNPESLVEGTGDTALCFIYFTVDGFYQLVPIDVEEFLEESEFLDGLRVDNHKVYVKIDQTSEPFLTVSENGVKLSGVQDAIDATVNTETERAQAAEQALQDNIDAEQARAEAAEQALQDNIDAEQARAEEAEEKLDNKIDAVIAGAGLNEDGSHKQHNIVPDDVANYIMGSHSLDEADMILDNKLFQLSGKTEAEIARLDEAIDDNSALINDLQEELDRTQDGAGLAADGSYEPIPSANYINEAISLKEADLILDRTINQLSAGTVSELQTLDEKIENEIARATEREDQISGDVTTLAIAVTEDIEELYSQITNEIDRATQAENAISSDIRTLSASTFELSGNTENRIREETERAMAAEDELRNSINENRVISLDNTVKITRNSSINGTDLAVNIDGATIAKDSNGVLAAKIEIQKLATPSSTNVKEEYALVDNNGNQLGDTVKVYKDTSLESVELVNIGGKEYLRFHYILADGSTSQVDLDVSAFLSETEFKDGLKVTNSNVYVLIDPTSETFLTVSSNGVKLSGVQNAIDSAVNSEKAAREAADTTLQTNINNLRTDATNSATTLYNALTAETYNRETADSTLQNNINSEQDRATAAENQLRSDLNTEINNRSTADTALNNAITAETQARSNADTALQNSITDEVTRATTIEQELRNLISNETLARQNGDTQNTNAINTESTRAQAAESSLQTLIDNEVTDRQTAISDEIANRTAADNQLQSNIDDMYTAYTHAITEESTSRIDTDNMLLSLIQGLSGATGETYQALQQEIIRATNAETYISGNVTTLSSSTVEINNNLTVLSSTTKEIQSGLTQLSGSVITLSSTTNTINNNLTTLSGSVTALSSTTVEIRNDVTELSGSVVSFSSSTHTEITDIKERLNNLSSKSVAGSQAIKVAAGTGSNSGVSTVSLLINGADKVLTQDDSGLLTNLSMELSNDSKTLYLKGKNGTTISTIDTTNFVKDGMLDSVTFDSNTKTLKFVFNTDSGHAQIDVPLGSLVDIYTVSAGSTTYLEIENYKVGARVDVDGGLAGYTKLRQLSGDVVTLSGNVVTLSGTVVNIQSGLTQLSGNVVTISGNVTTLSGNLITLSSTTKEIQSGLTQLSGTVLSIQSGLTVLSGDVTNLSAQTVNNTEEINNLKQQISAITQQVSALTQTVNNMETNIEQYLNDHLYDAIKAMLKGTTDEIKLTTDDTNSTITIGFDDPAHFGNGDGYNG